MRRPAKSAPRHRVTMRGRAAYDSGKPLYSLTFDGWKLATDGARERLRRLVADSHLIEARNAALGYGA